MEEGGAHHPSALHPKRTSRAVSRCQRVVCCLHTVLHFMRYIYSLFFLKKKKKTYCNNYIVFCSTVHPSHCVSTQRVGTPTVRIAAGHPRYIIYYFYLTILEQLFFPSFRGSSTTSDIKSHFFSHAEHTADGAVGLCPCVVCGGGANKAAHVQADSHGHQEMVHNSLTLAQNYTQQKNDVVI